MINTILLSLIFTSFFIERFYFYRCYNKKKQPLLNFNQHMHQPLNTNNNKQHIHQPLNIEDDSNIYSNTNITEYILYTRTTNPL